MSAKAKPKPSEKSVKKSKLLSSGNPQVSKGDGDGFVQEYIAAMPGWKRQVGLLIDKIVSKTAPHVQKAVRWNTPFYGVKGQGWFLCVYCYAKYVQVSFLKGGSLQPPPPDKSKLPDVKYLNIYEKDEFDESQFESWIKQASKIPGDKSLF